MNLNIQRLIETLMKYLIFAILLSIYLIPSNLKSQDISTVGEIYDYEIGDIFHFDFYGTGSGYGMSSVTNIEIIDYYYSQNNDTIFYVRDIDYKESSSENPQTTYEYYIDTIFYDNIDSLINSGFIDSVYTNLNMYNGRTINHVSYGNEDTWTLNFVNGCGQVETNYTSWGHTVYSEDKLVYYKKGDEEWGNPLPVSVENINANTIDIKIYPNPTKDFVNIKSPDFENCVVTITSLTGKKSKTTELITTLTSIDISDLTSGIYLMCIKKNERTIYRKFIKE